MTSEMMSSTELIALCDIAQSNGIPKDWTVKELVFPNFNGLEFLGYRILKEFKRTISLYVDRNLNQYYYYLS